MRIALLAAVLALGIAVGAPAVIIDSGDGTGNTTAPVPDPGWRNIGEISGRSGVYLGGRFALTAHHVGPGSIVLDGVTYAYVPGTAVQLDNGDGTYADLVMFQIHPAPPLPALAIASVSPPEGTAMILTGRGVDRGPATSFDPNAADPPPPVFGYEWGAGHAKRWGTNSAAGALRIDLIDGTQTLSILTRFDPAGSAHEAQAAAGDSGGAAFAWNGSQWQLAGILFAVGASYTDQPPETSLYGNLTLCADLSAYRAQILDVMALPEPRGGIYAGALITALLARVSRARLQSPPRSSTRA